MVKQRGGVISFDPNIRPEILRNAGIREALQSILEQTDVFLPSGDEVTLLVDAQTEAEAVKPLLALGIREIVVKHGSAGCTFTTVRPVYRYRGLRSTRSTLLAPATASAPHTRCAAMKAKRWNSRCALPARVVRLP